MNFFNNNSSGVFLIQELLRHLFYTYMEDNSAMYNVCRMKDRVTRPWFYKLCFVDFPAQVELIEMSEILC